VTQFDRPPLLGFKEQIFGVNQQIRSRALSDKEVFGPTSNAEAARAEFQHSATLPTCPGFSGWGLHDPADDHAITYHSERRDYIENEDLDHALQRGVP